MFSKYRGYPSMEGDNIPSKYTLFFNSFLKKTSIFYTKNVIKSNMSSCGGKKIKVFSIFAVDFKVNINSNTL